MAITWRNVNAPDQGAALGFSQLGANQLNAGISRLTSLAQDIAQQDLTEFNRTKEANTVALLNQINDVSELSALDELRTSGDFNVSNLRSTYGDAIDVGAIQQALTSRGRSIREETLGEQRFADTQLARQEQEGLNTFNALLANNDFEGADSFIQSTDIRDKLGLRADLQQARTNQINLDNTNRDRLVADITKQAVATIDDNPDNYDSIVSDLTARLADAGASAVQTENAIKSVRGIQVLKGLGSPEQTKRDLADALDQSTQAEVAIERDQQALNTLRERNPYSSVNTVKNSAVDLNQVYERINEIAPDNTWNLVFNGLGGKAAKDFVANLSKQQVKLTDDGYAEATQADINNPDISTYSVEPWMILQSLQGAANDLPQGQRQGLLDFGDTEIDPEDLRNAVYGLAVNSTVERRKVQTQEDALTNQINTAKAIKAVNDLKLRAKNL